MPTIRSQQNHQANRETGDEFEFREAKAREEDYLQEDSVEEFEEVEDTALE